MNWTVLIVDDEEEILRSLQHYLAFSEYNAITAGSGAEALSIIRKQKVHVVLCDIKMPEMDGLETLRHIHAFDFSIQVIMMTGYSTFQTTLQALEAGAADYILKPFEDMEEITKLIEIATDRLERWRRVLSVGTPGSGEDIS